MAAIMDAPVLEEVEQLDPDKHSHIIYYEKRGDAAAKVTEAYVEGTPLTALCGHVFVPSKDPTNLPVCPKCKDIWERATGKVWG